MSLAFASDWLALREPADHASRSKALTAPIVDRLARHDAPLVVDLGCGRGSNLRFLHPRLPATTRWRLVDQDEDLLAAARASVGADVRAELVTADLRSTNLAALLAGADLVTAAALLDLVSRPWLEALADACVTAGAVFLATGNIDGRIAWSPADAADEAMIAAFLGHHGGEKGFGAALGSQAPTVVQEVFRARGWAVTAAPADWDLGAEAAALQRAYLDGAVDAIFETGTPAATVAAWRAAREAAIDRGTSRLVVGHLDVLAEPPSGP